MKTQILAVAAVAVLGLSVSAKAGTIDVQFGCSSGCSGSPTPGGTQSQTGAAVVGNSGDVWNMAASSNGHGSLSSLVDTSGNSTGVALTWSAAGEWNESNNSDPYNNTAFAYSSFDPNVLNPNPLYANLMGSYLTFSPNSTGSMDITGLTAGAEYGIYFYSQANQNTDGRDAAFDANGVDVSTVQGTCGVTPLCPDNLNYFVQGVNYAFADDVVANSNGDINVAITVPSSYEGDVNGFQLESLSSASTPEPATAGLMLLALGAGASLLRRRRHSR